MKKLFITAIALSTVLSLSSCGDNTEHKSKSGSKIKSDINSSIEVETITELHPGTVDTIALVDPFETLSLSIDNEKSAYPECLDIKLNYGEKDFSDQIEYKAKLISADNKKIVVKITADPDEEAMEELFVDMKYRIKSDIREYKLSMDEVPICLLDNSLLTNENLESIDKMCREVVDRRIQCWIDNEIFEHDHTGDDEYELVSIYASNGRIEDYISTPLDIDLGYPYYFIGRDMDVHNNRLIFVYKSKSDIYYVVTAHPVFLNGELLSERCTVFTDTAGLLMQYDSEEEAEESIKNWLKRMVVGYQDGDLVKIANFT